MGTILRTAIAAGITDVVALGGADVYSPKVVRASMGGIYRLRVHPREDRAWPYTHPVHILDMAGDDLFDYVPPRRYALVAGSEAAGVSPEMRRIAAKSLSIPMQGGIESLNVAVATAIALYQLQHNAQ